jgi:DNA-3-methyladenine glycosylase II
MYLMFTLGRPDVWPVDDLGVRKGWMIAHGLPEMPKPKPFKTMADHLRPYRTQVAWYCWRAVDTVTPDA